MKKYRVCKTKGCRRKASETKIPLPYEYQGGKHIIIFGLVFHIYKDKADYAYEECDECYFDRMKEKGQWYFN